MMSEHNRTYLLRTRGTDYGDDDLDQSEESKRARPQLISSVKYLCAEAGHDFGWSETTFNFLGTTRRAGMFPLFQRSSFWVAPNLLASESKGWLIGFLNGHRNHIPHYGHSDPVEVGAVLSDDGHPLVFETADEAKKFVDGLLPPPKTPKEICWRPAWGDLEGEIAGRSRYAISFKRDRYPLVVPGETAWTLRLDGTAIYRCVRPYELKSWEIDSEHAAATVSELKTLANKHAREHGLIVGGE